MLTLTILVTISTFLAMPILTMLPAFASEVLTGCGHAANTAVAADGLAGAGRHHRRAHRGSRARTNTHFGRLLLGVQVGLGLLIAGFALSTSLPLSLVLLFFGGIFFMASFSISFSLLQMTVPDDLRGRVVSIYMVALRGGGPIGGLVAGALADVYSASSVMAVNGLLLAVIAGSLFLFRRRQRA